jgi:hypothetical protein
MNFALEDTRRKLTATANKFGWKTKVGHRCSNLIQQLEIHRTATGDQKAHLEKAISLQMTELAALAPVSH